MTERVRLKCNGQLITGWRKVQINCSMDALAREFSVDIVRGADTAEITTAPGMPCEVQIVNDATGIVNTLLKGYVDGTTDGGSANENVFEIKGRCVCGDLVDCSVIHKSGTWFRATLQTIVEAVCKPFGVGVTFADETAAKTTVDRFALQQGESAFDAISRLCASAGVLPQSTSDGRLWIGHTGKDSPEAVEVLEVGKNILAWKVTRDDSARHSQYYCKGQQGGRGVSWTGDQTAIAATARDTAVGRYRPFLFMAETRADRARLRQRVQWEAQVRAGRSMAFEVTLAGWYQRNAKGYAVKPWALNERVTLRIPSLGIDTQLIVAGVKMSLDSSEGRRTELTLRDAATFAQNPMEAIELW
jgi:prophage tail gpP-like protein